MAASKAQPSPPASLPRRAPEERTSFAAALRRSRRELERRLFRLRGPEPAPIVLSQRRVFVMPTRNGTVFAAVVMLLLIGSINYSLSLGYALTFLLGGLGVVAILHAFRNLAQLRITPGRTEPAFAGEHCAYSLVLHNLRNEPRPALLLSADGAEPVLLMVPARACAEAKVLLPAPRRGWLRPGRMRLETRYPLGLIRAWSYIEPDLRCLVYPKPEQAPPPLPRGGSHAFGMQGAARGSDDFLGLRNYQAGDSPRHIAWKAVAGDAPPMTKQFAGSGSADIWLDWSELPPQLDVEARLSRLAAWVLAAQRADASFGLRLPGLARTPARDDAHVRDCLKALALHGDAQG